MAAEAMTWNLKLVLPRSFKKTSRNDKTSCSCRAAAKKSKQRRTRRKAHYTYEADDAVPGALRYELQLIKSSYEDIIENWNRSQEEHRKRKLRFYGFSQCKCGDSEPTELIRELLTDGLKIMNDEVDSMIIENVNWVMNNRTEYLLAEFTSIETRNKIFSAAKKLRKSYKPYGLKVAIRAEPATKVSMKLIEEREITSAVLPN